MSRRAVSEAGVVTMSKEPLKGAARAELGRILDAAVELKADEVTIEWDTDGLEVTMFRGEHGIGRVIHDFEIAREALSLVIDGANLEHNESGVFAWKRGGRTWTFQVTTYDSFGETCFRLTPMRPKKGCNSGEAASEDAS